MQNASITPKQHILEEHVCPWMHRWGVGMAKFGEQSGEQAHATVNAFKKSTSGIRNNGERLLFMLKQHFLLLSPQIQIESCID